MRSSWIYSPEVRGLLYAQFPQEFVSVYGGKGIPEMRLFEVKFI